MFAVRRSDERGRTQVGWLDSRHSFSFGDYFDRRHMGFRSLRVLNDDRVAPNSGFGLHGHRNMEIVTLVLSGALEHGDSLGHATSILPGEVQRMSAGSGIRHSEMNPSPTEPVHFLQIWIEPKETGTEPSYDQKPISDRRGEWQVLASPGGDAVAIRQDATILRRTLNANESVVYPLPKGRGAWIHVIEGDVTVGSQHLTAGDAVAVENEETIPLRAAEQSDVLLFDVA